MKDADSDDSSTQSDDSFKTAFEEIDIYDDNDSSFHIFVSNDGTIWLLPMIPLFISANEKTGEDVNDQIDQIVE